MNLDVKAQWKRWDERFAARTQRERAMIAIMLVVGVALIGSTLVVEPRFARAAVAKKNLAAQKAESDRLAAQWQALLPRLKEDPDAAARQELEILRAKLATINADLAKANAALVPPAEMNTRLERLLARQPGLRLVSLRTLPPTSFVDKKPEAATTAAQGTPAAEKPAGDFDLYRHGVEIKLTGSYADLSAYVAQLESDRQKFIWGEVRLSVVEYPKAMLTLVLYTLSLDKAWLSI